MGAIKLVKEKSKILLKKCIGCGLCVVSCPEEAITLVRKEEPTIPPSSEEELYAKILDKKLEIKGKK
jgi:electron transport complex protein RnfB